MTQGPELERLGDLLPPAAEPGAALPRKRGAVAPQAPVAAQAGGTGPAGAPDQPALERQLAGVWVDAVGAEVAENARPVQLRDGRLVVTTSSSAWAQTLQLMSQMVIGRLNERLGEGTVQKAVFRHAGWEPAPDRAASASAPVAAAFRPAAVDTPAVVEPETPTDKGGPSGWSDEEREALADLERLPLPPSVKQTIRDAMTAGFVRARQDSGRS
jgi:Dna[CI] antecedent, DciA